MTACELCGRDFQSQAAADACCTRPPRWNSRDDWD